MHNHEVLQRLQPHAKLCHVLKSNAYGHGLKEVAPIFDTFGSPYLIVDSLYEAYELYKLHVKTPILILGYTNPDNFKVKRLPFSITVFDVDTVHALGTYQPYCNIHIFVDTGMCREGVQITNLLPLVETIQQYPKLNVVGLCSHFADADNEASRMFTNSQIKAFKQALHIVQKHGFQPIYRHIAASTGTLIVHDKCFTMLRVGLASYGISPLLKNIIYLKPALSFTSTLAMIKTIPKGSKIGYSCTYTAKKPMTIGIIPAGYYEGLDRRLSNAGVVKIRNTYCPIIGRVSMNMTTIDISGLSRPRIGEQIVVYSNKIKDANSLVHAARVCKTIPYELMVHLASSVKRNVIE